MSFPDAHIMPRYAYHRAYHCMICAYHRAYRCISYWKHRTLTCAYHTENTEHWPITQNSNRANIASRPSVLWLMNTIQCWGYSPRFCEMLCKLPVGRWTSSVWICQCSIQRHNVAIDLNSFLLVLVTLVPARKPKRFLLLMRQRFGCQFVSFLWHFFGW